MRSKHASSLHYFHLFFARALLISPGLSGGQQPSIVRASSNGPRPSLAPVLVRTSPSQEGKLLANERETWRKEEEKIVKTSEIIHNAIRSCSFPETRELTIMRKKTEHLSPSSLHHLRLGLS